MATPHLMIYLNPMDCYSRIFHWGEGLHCKENVCVTVHHECGNILGVCQRHFMIYFEVIDLTRTSGHTRHTSFEGLCII